MEKPFRVGQWVNWIGQEGALFGAPIKRITEPQTGNYVLWVGKDEFPINYQDVIADGLLFRLSITTFDLVGGIHFYGSIYSPDGVKIYECVRPDTENPYPVWYDDEDKKHWTTIKFFTVEDVVRAAKKWFLESPDIREGSLLKVWRRYFDGPVNREYFDKL